MKSMREKIWEKVSPVPESGCWLWTGATFNHGRPQIRLGEKLVSGHRASYEAFVGPVPEGMCVCHKCDTPLCVNPAHLFVGTQQDNNADKVRKGRQAFLRGELNGTAKLTEADVARIRSIYASGGVGSEAIGREFGVSGRQIRNIVGRRQWAHSAKLVGVA